MPLCNFQLRTDLRPGASGGGTWLHLGYSATPGGTPGGGGTPNGPYIGDDPIINPDGYIPGFYHDEYTITGQCGIQVQTRYQVRARPNAGDNGSDSACTEENVVIDLNTVISGQDTGGVWTVDPSSPTALDNPADFDAGAGTFNPQNQTTPGEIWFRYTKSADPPEPGFVQLTPCENCDDDISRATITIIQQADAGTAQDISVCN